MYHLIKFDQDWLKKATFLCILILYKSVLSPSKWAPFEPIQARQRLIQFSIWVMPRQIYNQIFDCSEICFPCSIDDKFNIQYDIYIFRDIHINCVKNLSMDCRQIVICSKQNMIGSVIRPRRPACAPPNSPAREIEYYRSYLIKYLTDHF